MKSLAPLFRRLNLVEIKIHPPEPETRFPYIVIDLATGNDLPGFEAHNAEHRALAKRRRVSPKAYGFDPEEEYSTDDLSVEELQLVQQLAAFAHLPAHLREKMKLGDKHPVSNLTKEELQEAKAIALKARAEAEQQTTS